MNKFIVWSLVALALAVGCGKVRSAGAADIIPFVCDRAEVKQIDGRWKVVDGDHWLMDFGDSEGNARKALATVKHYRMNKLYFLGRPTRLVHFYLCNDQPPTGPFEGEDAVHFNPANVEAKKIDGRWKVVDGDNWIADLQDQEDETKKCAELIRKYGFEYICFVGRPNPGMTYFRCGGPGAPATIAAPALTGGARLKVTVIEGNKGPVSRPMITVRKANNPNESPVSLTENPSEFSLPPGAYGVTVRVGADTETSPRRVELTEGKTQDLLINVGTGTLELTLTAGGRPMTRVPLVHLRAGSRTIASLSESPARFQAPEGNYAVRVEFLTSQFYEIPNLAIVAGEKTAKTAEVPCAPVVVTVTGGQYSPGSGKFAMVQIHKEGQPVTALADNPARFILLTGEYTISAREGDKVLATTKITVEAGQELAVELKVGGQ